MTAKITIMPLGLKACITSHHKRTPPPPRSAINGWSVSASRRNAGFLMSVDPSSLNGFGMALSLTLKECPLSSKVWHSLIDGFLKRLRRMSMIRYHWVTEWQRRGVPHLHAMVYFDRHVSSHVIMQHWLDVAAEWSASPYSQHVVPIDNAAGWFRYLAKHCARGASHYQRDRKNLPKVWQSTGRLWSKGGQWPTDHNSMLLRTDCFHKLRRLVLGYLRSDARSELRSARRLSNPSNRAVRVSQALRRLSYLKGMMRIPERKRSSVRAISEWVPEHLVSEMVFYLVEALGPDCIADPFQVGDDFVFPPCNSLSDRQPADALS